MVTTTMACRGSVIITKVVTTMHCGFFFNIIHKNKFIRVDIWSPLALSGIGNSTRVAGRGDGTFSGVGLVFFFQFSHGRPRSRF